MNTSQNGRAMIAALEGASLTCYRDIGGVPTIYAGLTNRSPAVTEMLGKLVPGKTRITAAQGEQVFAAVLAREVDPTVTDGMPGARQYEHDAGSSGTYNLGPRFMGWKWAKLWRAGKAEQAADYLATHYNTVHGRKVAGLTRRRRIEAKLLRTGQYPDLALAEGRPRAATRKPGKMPDPVVREAQQLLTATGFNPGAIDGWMGEKTKAAVLAYQRAHPDLVNDGILGPATLSQLRRDAQAAAQVVRDTVGKGGTTAAAGGLVSAFAGLPWHWIFLGILAAALVWALWRYRDVLRRRFNTLTGRTVEV